MSSRRPLSSLRLVWIYPDLLSTYGDRGNLQVLDHRATARGVDVEVNQILSDKPLPTQGDIYLLGGGEGSPQAVAAERLAADKSLGRAAERGAVIFGVCAGYEMLGSTFTASGEMTKGLGLLDVFSQRDEHRAVGELAAEADPRLGLPTLTGFENHSGRVLVGSKATPLGRVVSGIGNDGMTEGAWAGKILGTYLHGPALARNPALADLLITWVLGGVLPPLDDAWHQRLRNERLAAATGRPVPPDANDPMELM